VRAGIVLVLTCVACHAGVGGANGDDGSSGGDDTADDGGITGSDDASDVDGSSTMPDAGDPCLGLAPLGTGTGTTWKRAIYPTSVTWGGLTTKSGIDPKSYVQIWSLDYPDSNLPWPGNSGTTTQVTVGKNYYLAEEFVVPTDGSVTGNVKWLISGSGANSNTAFSVGICAGDFGQTGTQLAPGCSTRKANSSSGQNVNVGGSSGCALTPGGTYYLNLLPQAELPENDISEQSYDTDYPIRPWIGVFF
jgi:hypothetical protein